MKNSVCGSYTNPTGSETKPANVPEKWYQELSAKGKKYWEINQEVGDLLYVPPSLVRVSVNLEDSFSYFERLHTSQATAQAASRQAPPFRAAAHPQTR